MLSAYSRTSGQFFPLTGFNAGKRRSQSARLFQARRVSRHFFIARGRHPKFTPVRQSTLVQIIPKDKQRILCHVCRTALVRILDDRFSAGSSEFLESLVPTLSESTPSADICSKISFFHLFLVTSCTPFVKNLPRVGKSYPRRSLPAPEGASDEGGDLCGLSYPVPPRVLRFLRMHFVVARLTQADEIGCGIRKFRMLVRVLDVVHGRRLTVPPIPQAVPA